ncbi:MAG TPA: hypothetical protein VFW98_14510 [Gemmatimonadaceae bacterium]|nr:hypothetical protein [Gemmatimonadaceae bacterium]
MTNNDRAAIVAGHGDFATGIISAVDRITGCGELFVPMSNAGLGAEAIEQRLRELLAEHHAQVIFADLAAGSCSIAACRLVRECDVIVVTGVNLPALVFYATHQELPLREAAAQSVVRASSSIRLLAGK